MTKIRSASLCFAKDPNPRLLCFIGSIVSGNQAAAQRVFGRFMQTFLRKLFTTLIARKTCWR